MKKYILGKEVILRGYIDMPYAAYIRGCTDAIKITREDCHILEQAYTPCPQTVFESNPGARERLVRRGFIELCSEDREVKAYQKYRRCDNYYMPAANWAITGRCNYNCLHCFNASDNNVSHDEFSRGEALKLIEDFDECGIINITLTGGEPMLHPNLIEIIREINERGLVLKEVTTNGECITQAFLDELSKFTYKPLFKVSFDGLGHHDWLRNRAGSEKRTIERIRLLLENDFQVQLQTSVHKKNMESILPTAEFFDGLGVQFMRIIRTSESPRWAQNGQKYTLTIPEYYTFGLDFSEKYTDIGKKMQIYLWQVLSMTPEQKTYFHSNIKIQPSDYREDRPVCMHNKRRISITPAGEAVPCNQMSGWLNKLGIAFENVHRTALADILRDSSYLRMINYSVGELYSRGQRAKRPCSHGHSATAARVFDSGTSGSCSSCGYRQVCLGGCRACAILFDGQGLRPESETDDALRPYYQSPDPLKCLFFSEYKSKFDKLFCQKGWTCENNFSM